MLALYNEATSTCYWALFVPDKSSPSTATMGTLFQCVQDPVHRRWAYRPVRGFDTKKALLVLIVQLADVSFIGGPPGICEAVDAYLKLVSIPPQTSANGDNPGTLWIYAALRTLDDNCILTCRQPAQLKNEIDVKMIKAFPAFQRNLRPTLHNSEQCGKC